jgi:hypothetical protein
LRNFAYSKAVPASLHTVHHFGVAAALLLSCPARHRGEVRALHEPEPVLKMAKTALSDGYWRNQSARLRVFAQPSDVASALRDVLKNEGCVSEQEDRCRTRPSIVDRPERESLGAPKRSSIGMASPASPSTR